MDNDGNIFRGQHGGLRKIRQVLAGQLMALYQRRISQYKAGECAHGKMAWVRLCSLWAEDRKSLTR